MLLQIQTTPAGALESAVAPVEKTLSIWELISSGGLGGNIVMAAIGLMSIVAIYLFVERFNTIRKASRLDQNFMQQIRELVLAGKLEAARTLCKSQGSPVSRMIEKGISRIGKPLKDISAAIENTGKLEVSKLESNLTTLATISGAAPMLGFLGTVIGMILAFHQMAAAGGQIDVGMLAEGIYTAMTTTVAGLVVGIIAYVGYNYLVSRVDRVVYAMEAHAVDFMDLLNEPA
ncbi:MotA/TolQ/ExbB proton channel family protein [bacterium]|nr:MotA/TolQ/ExbB proton channel family protein [bacterium]